MLRFLLLAVMFQWVVGGAHAQLVGRDSGDEQSADQSEPNPPYNVLQRITEAMEAANDKPESADNRKHEQDDLGAQQDMAKWAKRMFWATVGSALFTAGGIVLVWLNLREAQKTTKAALRGNSRATRANIIARDAYIAEHRTWLKVRPISIGPAKFNGDQVRVTVEVQTENVGRFAAVNVELFCVPYRSNGFVVARSIAKDNIEWSRSVSTSTSGALGTILMAGDTFTASFTADAKTFAETEARGKEFKGISGKERPLIISAAYGVIYKSLASDQWRHTAYVLLIKKNDGTEFDPTVGEVGPEKLTAMVLPDSGEIS